jgi:hypothetical protein
VNGDTGAESIAGGPPALVPSPFKGDSSPAPPFGAAGRVISRVGAALGRNVYARTTASPHTNTHPTTPPSPAVRAAVERRWERLSGSAERWEALLEEVEEEAAVRCCCRCRCGSMPVAPAACAEPWDLLRQLVMQRLRAAASRHPSRDSSTRRLSQLPCRSSTGCAALMFTAHHSIHHPTSSCPHDSSAGSGQAGQEGGR